MKFKDELEKLDACSDAVGWVGNMDLSESWQKCERGDWNNFHEYTGVLTPKSDLRDGWNQPLKEPK